MKILVIGSGGREHALVWKLSQSPHISKLYAAPGNPGIARHAELLPHKATDIMQLVGFARAEGIDLTVVGPEQPLTEGITDVFQREQLLIFGPTRVASELEGSKVFAKQFMQKYNIPTAEFRTFTTAERYDAERYINEVPVPIVIKADGLAAGKGVAICDTKEQALEFLDLMMEQRAFGEAGRKVVIEEFLVGEEASVFAITDGKNFVTLPPAQYHKRILDNDLGKNTGGMGAYAPAPLVDDDMMARISRNIIRPTLLGMAEEQRVYRGCLYVGLMITQTGPKVVEFNCRFGDPETQVVLPLVDDDLLEVLKEAAAGSLTRRSLKVGSRSAACVVIASGGYPDHYEDGKQIVGLDRAEAEEGVMIFHGGTKQTREGILTAGGRVLGVTAVGSRADLENTIAKAYRAVEKITFDGAYYRSDIGKKGVQYLRKIQETGQQ
jgi:phosphoribosylamine--glycine ligase